MLKIESITKLQQHVRHLRRASKVIGFVPTMGAIHEGHCSLMRAGRAECDELIASIFVNPTQFCPGEDYAKYPRPLERDLAACEAEGVDTVFCPDADEMYPAGSATTVSVSGLTDGLCGAYRPGHFDGVTTIVAKLFNIVQPDIAYFGQKDAQQAAVIRRMVRDLIWPIKIVICPTIREPDGLAISSRNAYLTPEQRKQALSLYAALEYARRQIQAGRLKVADLTAEMRQRIEAAGPCSIDYIEIIDAHELIPKNTVQGRCLIALAVRIGKSRLIDNIEVDAGTSKS
ncbi:MAG: pantoate--beta-alanine ligase [Planctomycetota bacterium]|nr:MAG: pantoate--beta-alanine ligase [Planctomycetota bacterium]